MMAVFVTAVSFVLGSFPSGFVLACFFTGRDIRNQGSGNIGASNVTASAGLPLGIAVGILDTLKGAVAVMIGRGLGLRPDALAVVALAAVLGHNFSIFLRFRGGKGVSTSFGACFALAPPAALLSMTSWLAAGLLVGYASVASLLALALLPGWMIVTGQHRSYIALAVALFLLAMLKHWENILRLIHGKEPKIRRPWTRS